MLHPILNTCRLGLMALLFTCASHAYGQGGGTHIARTLWSANAPHRVGREAAESNKTRDKKDKSTMVYIGTYTGAKSKGIYIYKFDTETGELTAAGVSPETANPSFVAIHPNGRYLYAVNEVDSNNGTPGGAVTAFAIDHATGALSLLNQQSTRGGGPCYVAVDHAGKNVLVANYGGGSIACLPLEADGKLKEASAFVQHEGSSVNKDRQEGPHAHSIYLDPTGKYALVCDLGLDKIFVYRFDPVKGTLTPNDPPFVATKPGAGPRHLAFSHNGRFIYATDEMGNTVTTYSYDGHTGTLKELQSLPTLPEGFTGDNTTAEIVIHPNGKFLYDSNRGDNSIAIYSIDPTTGLLTAIGHEPTQGKTPRNFTIDPTGHFLLAANQNSDSVVVFRIDAQTGKLTATGHTYEVPSPVCITFQPTK